jgi:pimeloyl-ACP methyl ester carboxylesterase
MSDIPQDANLPDIGRVSTELVDGLRIRMARSGRTDGVPILFTSPWPESLYSFWRILPHFTHAHPVVAVDLPGFGLSQSRPDVMSPKAMGAFLVKLAQHLKLERLHGIGPDVGTPAFLFAAAGHPELFESLVLGGGATRIDLAAGRLRDLIASPQGAFAAVDGAAAVADYLTQAKNNTPPAVIEDFRAASAGRRFEEAVQFVRGYDADLPLIGRSLAQIQAPVLVLAGRDDPIVPPANNQWLSDQLPRSRLALLDAGHRAWAEASAAYVGEIMTWVGGGYRER